MGGRAIPVLLCVSQTVDQYLKGLSTLGDVAQRRAEPPRDPIVAIDDVCRSGPEGHEQFSSRLRCAVLGQIKGEDLVGSTGPEVDVNIIAVGLKRG